jgi:enterochelin esterase-like enzyme
MNPPLLKIRLAFVAIAFCLCGQAPFAAPGADTNPPATPAPGAPAPPNQPKPNANAPGARRTFPKGEWVDPDHTAPNGTKYVTFPSKVLGHEVSCLVYLPPGHDESTQRYPVIYWLHGMGGNQRAGASVYVPMLAAATQRKELPPSIVVLVNGMVTSFYCDSTDGKVPEESVIIKDLIPYVDQTYRTIAKREARVIEGYSMGGSGTAHLGFKYPDLFGAVVINAGALLPIEAPAGAPGGGPMQGVFGDDKERRKAEHPLTLAEKNASQLRGKTRIRIGCGSADSLLKFNQDLHERLQQLNIEHEFVIVPDVAHNPPVYYRTLGDKCFEFHRKFFEALAESGTPSK